MHSSLIECIIRVYQSYVSLPVHATETFSAPTSSFTFLFQVSQNTYVIISWPAVTVSACHKEQPGFDSQDLQGFFQPPYTF